MPENRFFRFFFTGLFITGLIPYLNVVLPFLPEKFLGMNYTGWAWVVMYLFTLITFTNVKRAGFPFILWLPWMLYLVLYIIIDFSFSGLQLTFQYLLPILVSIPASSFTYTSANLKWLTRLISVFFILVALISGISILLTGYSPYAASVAMTLSIAAALCVAAFSVRKKIKYLLYYLALLSIPLAMTTRMGLFSFIAVFAVNFADRWGRKLVYALLAIPLFLFVFYSESFQQKTFISGQGSVGELTLNYYENEDIRASGRKLMHEALMSGVKESPVWGNGPRSDLLALSSVGLIKAEGHNDYLTVRYNYGWVGLILVLGGLILQFLFLYRKRNRYKGSPVQFTIWAATMVLFVSLLLFMYSDNILKYTIFFPNIFFVMIGMLYGRFQGTFNGQKVNLR